MTEREKHIKNLIALKDFCNNNGVFTLKEEIESSLVYAISSIKTDLAYDLEYERTTDCDACTLDVEQAYENGVARGFNVAMRKISLSGIHEQQYKRGRVDELKEIRAEMAKYGSVWMEYAENMSKEKITEKCLSDCKKAFLAVLDKKIAELEGGNDQ